MSRVFFLFCCIAIAAADAQANQCLTAKSLRNLDQRYEDALRVGDVKFLQRLLAEEFVWVHNLAVDIESKPRLLARMQAQQENTKARKISDVTLHRLEKTAVVSGLSSVEKVNPGDETVSASRYRFMRTYVASGKECRLLSVQTMKVWTSEGPSAGEI